MKALTYVELDVDRCQLEYGTTNEHGTCPAVLGVDSSIKCFNSLGTCPATVRASFNNEPVTYRYAVASDYRPTNIDAIPSITDVSFTPATISLGKDLGQRASVRVTFKDHEWGDAAPSYDKYASERGYNPSERGTYWGKFRARNFFMRGRNFRLVRGFLGQTLEEMETRHFVVEATDGPTPDGTFTIVAKDILKFADGDRAQAPVINDGQILTGISSGDGSLTLQPTGIGETYPAAGYVALGGKEIASYTLPHNTVLVLNFEGADGATDIEDESASAHSITVGGDAEISTDEFVFGRSSLYLPGGASDEITAADHTDFDFGSADFTIEIRVIPDNVSQGAGILSKQTAFGPFLILQNLTGYEFFASSNGSTWDVADTQSLGAAVAGEPTLLTVCREGTNIRLFRNGAIVTTISGVSASLVNNSDALRIGAASSASANWAGHVDAVRLLKGEALYPAAFDPPAVPPDMGYGNSNTMTLTGRGLLGTAAQAHSAGDRVQYVLAYVGQDPADIIWDLLVKHGGVSPGYIDLTAWHTETAAYLQRLYTGYIAEPTSISELLSEIIEQAALVLWWDEISQLIRLQVLRGIATDVGRFTQSNVLFDTLTIREQPALRVSQVWTYFAQRNPLEPLDNTDNYRSTATTIDLIAEADYGLPAIKKIFSRWIPFGSRSVALRLNQLQLARYRDPPRRFSFDVFRIGSGVTPMLGVGYRLEAWPIQDATGAASDVPMQITRLNPEADKYSIEAEEVVFTGFDPEDLTDRTIIIDADVTSVNLRTLHDTIYPDPTDEDVVYGGNLTCIIESGINIGATNVGVPAFNVGTWPSGFPITLVVRGRIQGAGGQGGFGGGTGNGSGTVGQTGGIALYTRHAIDLEYTDGEIWSGGGGGGGGGGGFDVGGGGAGGGAGRPPGSGQLGGPSGPAGTAGTTEAGGPGGNAPPAAGDGGAGGGPGLNGANGANGLTGGNGAAAGAAGAAIDGVSYVTVTGAAGDLRGTQVS